MTKIVYIEHDGATHEVQVPNGLSVMEGAVNNSVPGIDADCGGACACATCHVLLDAAWFDRVGPAGSDEQEMLEFAPGVTPRSRLSCQITVSAALEGLVVHVPETQR